jgi:hypothetical protein
VWKQWLAAHGSIDEQVDEMGPASPVLDENSPLVNTSPSLAADKPPYLPCNLLPQNVGRPHPSRILLTWTEYLFRLETTAQNIALTREWRVDHGRSNSLQPLSLPHFHLLPMLRLPLLPPLLHRLRPNSISPSQPNFLHSPILRSVFTFCEYMRGSI